MKQRAPSPPSNEAHTKSASGYADDRRPESEAQADFIASIPSSPLMVAQGRMANLIQRKPKPSNPKVAQFTLAVQITPGKSKGKVGKVNAVGRPTSPYSGTMGDHSTAFITHVLGIRMLMEEQTYLDSFKRMNKLV